ncbi:hypothetical protein GTY86_37755 [Streptomyces sp. SID5770]|uniref:S1 family peptidase n=1 Tax=Streptomyces sp. SID5770 TaxID=2690308 RepID=UPI0013694573|nr:S1 family peptidase [Streptomyces sp. SID5770]MZE56915.1 hypothetical protein [Streptomyces sp. SID5770]
MKNYLKLISVALTCAGIAISSSVEFSAAAADSGKVGSPSSKIAAEAKIPGTTESSAEKALNRLEKFLGIKSGGVWIDENGTAHAAITDSSLHGIAESIGVVAHRVKWSAADLAGVQSRLDEYAKSRGAGKVRSWSVQPQSNSLVISIPVGSKSDAATARFLDFARKLPAVQIHETQAGALRFNSDVYGGDEIFGVTANGMQAKRCSNGFNATDQFGIKYMITAGHCVRDTTWWRVGDPYGTDFGYAGNYSNPGDDYGVIVKTDPWVYNLKAAFWKYGVGGGANPIKGYSNAPIGSAVCHSGATTGWRCGKIDTKNVSIPMGNGVVSGLTKYTACSEPGDSGGPVVRYQSIGVTGYYAQGVDSISGQFEKNGESVCGEKVGKPNESYFQPIGEILSAYNLSLMTS